MADAQAPIRLSAWYPSAPNVDGAVAELTDHGDGFITADIRIPGPGRS